MISNRVICLGDSITKGKVWKETERHSYITENSYPQLLKMMLGIDVLNEGICDITSVQMLRHLENDIVIEKGSIAIIEIGGNDCNPNWREVKKDPYGEHEGVVPAGEFRNNLLKIIGMVKASEALPVLCTLPPLDADKFFNLLKRCFGMDIKLWIDRNGGIYKWQERYSDIVREIAEKEGIDLIDIRQAFLDTGDYKKHIGVDGIHPLEDGYSLIAETCCKTLKSILAYNMYKMHALAI
jgi:lysophospholipase L1-like esterase